MATYIYANLATLKLHNDVRIMVQLTNDSDGVNPADESQINEDILAAMENVAATDIDNALRNIYLVPLTGVSLTPEIVYIAAKLTWCKLWERRGDESPQVTELRRNMYKRLIGMGAVKTEENRADRLAESLPKSGFVQGSLPRSAYDQTGYFDALPARNTGA